MLDEEKPSEVEGASPDEPAPASSTNDAKAPSLRGKKAAPAKTQLRKAKPKAPSPRRNPSVQPRSFPIFSLERSLSVAIAIKDKNAGNPWPPTEVSKALGYAEKSSSVDIILRSSAMYGLTTGTRGASHVTLEKIGREIVYAPTPEAEMQAKQRAFINVELFSKVLGYYKGNNLPETQFLSNTLVSEFGVSAEYHEEFRKLFDENCRYVGIGATWTGLGQAATSMPRTQDKRQNIPNVRAYTSETNPDGKNALSLCHFPSDLVPARQAFSMKSLRVSLNLPPRRQDSMYTQLTKTVVTSSNQLL